ncbi:MAG: hypothetical protein PUD93_12900 [Lachnospiraceae bacterium]|nr:hypothetical protein [Lachnospiraceae bacterium]
MKQRIRFLFAGTLACVWWFLFYPELCFPEDTYEVIYQGETYGGMYRGETCDMERWQEIEELLQADEEQIIVKSRLWEVWKQLQN